MSYIASDRDDRFLSLTETSSNVQLFSVRTQYEFPLITTINFARNENKFTGGADNFNFNLLGGRAEYSFFNKRLQTYFSTNYTSASGVTSITDTTQTITNYTRLGFNLGARFAISPGHFILIA